MENSSRWKDKNAIPVPDPEKGEILYTRKMFNWTIPWMIIGSVIMLLGSAYPVYLTLKRGYTMADVPQGYAGCVMMFLGIIWMCWAIIRFSTPRNGRIIMKKHLLLEYLSPVVLGLVMFSFPYVVFLIRWSEFWGQVIRLVRKPTKGFTYFSKKRNNG